MSIQNPRGTSSVNQTQHAEHNTSQHHAAGGSSGHGRFGTYVFRIGRAPVQSGAKRPQKLRQRPAPKQAQASEGMEMGQDVGQDSRDSSVDDERHRRPEIETGSTSTGQGNDHPDGQPPAKRLKVSVPPATSDPAQLLGNRLKQAGWPGADVLWGPPPQRNVKSSLHAKALMEALLAASQPAAARPAAAGPGTPLRMQLVKAFMKTGGDTSELATLGGVKHMATTCQANQPPRARHLPLTDMQISINVLNIVMALNVAKPRTPEQSALACHRIDMMSRAPSVQGVRA